MPTIRRLLVSARRSALIIDGTSFRNRGRTRLAWRRIAGAARSRCQVAVTAALWTGTRAWLLGALLYLPQSWSEDANRRAAARVPSTVTFQEKWRQALTLIRRARAAGLHLTAVVADAEFGDITAFRRLLHQWRLPYALGVSRQLTVFRGTPAVHIPPSSRTGRPRSHGARARHSSDHRVPWRCRRRAWRRVTGAMAPNRPCGAVAAVASPANEAPPAPEVWLLCEQDLGLSPRIKYFFVHLPATASLKQLVRLAHQRWAIEQQYQDLKTELGLDHFEGRSYPGWHRHVVLTAVAYAFLQRERIRPDADPALTLPAVRAIVTETFTALLFAQKPSYLKRIQELQNIQLRI
jgi:SRSO17 transposase